MVTRNPRLLIVDIASPRNVEPNIAEIEGVTLFHIDDLKCVVENNRELRKLAS